MNKIEFIKVEKDYRLIFTTKTGKFVTIVVSGKANQIISTLKEWIKDNEQSR